MSFSLRFRQPKPPAILRYLGSAALFMLLSALLLSACDRSANMQSTTVLEYNNSGRIVSNVRINGQNLRGLRSSKGQIVGGRILLPRDHQAGTPVQIAWERDDCPAAQRNCASGAIPYQAQQKVLPLPGASAAAHYLQLHFLPDDQLRLTVLPMSR